MTNTETAENFPLVNQIITDEISGKNKAIHAYDTIIWKVRSGYLTLIFAGWGIILTALIGKEIQFLEAKPYILSMLLVSSGLSISGFSIDINYVRRKFRVIRDINKILKLVPNLGIEGIKNYLDDISQFMRISGDSGDDSYKEVKKGYNAAFLAALVVYFIPLLVLLAGLFLIGL